MTPVDPIVIAFAVEVPRLRVPAAMVSSLPVAAGIVSTPPVVTFSPVEVKAKVPEEFPTAVFPVPEVLRLRVGAVIAAVPDELVRVNPVSPVADIAPDVPVKFRAPVERVNPFEAVKSPAEVIVPVEVVEMLPVVVMLSPVFEGERVVPVLFQNPESPVPPPPPPTQEGKPPPDTVKDCPVEPIPSLAILPDTFL